MHEFDGDPTGFPLQLSFVHRRLFGAAKSFIGSGFSPTAALAGFVTGGGGGGGAQTAVLGGGGSAIPGVVAGRARLSEDSTIFRTLRDTSGLACKPGFERDTLGNCVPTSTFGVALPILTGTPLKTSSGKNGMPKFLTGEAVMGRYGAGLTPHEETRLVRTCLPGMVLGDDGICYNRSTPGLRREHPKGRAPLLTGGERNAISTAARAAKKIVRTTKQLQKLGMLPKPKSTKKAPKVPLALPAGSGVHVVNVE